MLSFGKFRDQKVLVMKKLYYLEQRMVISSITYCRRSFHVKCKDFLPQGNAWEVFNKRGCLVAQQVSVKCPSVLFTVAPSPALVDKEEISHLKKVSNAAPDQPSWMELAKKKSQAWSDMPQIIK